MRRVNVALLIGAGKRKVDEAAPAQDLYIGSLFRLRRAYAERAGLPWFVLSPKYGLVAPDDLLEPYDLAMIRQPIAYRREWSAAVAARLDDLLGPAAGRTLEVQAGAAYVEPLEPLLAADGWSVLAPLRGLNQGQQAAWYRARSRQRGPSPGGCAKTRSPDALER